MPEGGDAASPAGIERKILKTVLSSDGAVFVFSVSGNGSGAEVRMVCADRVTGLGPRAREGNLPTGYLVCRVIRAGSAS